MFTGIVSTVGQVTELAKRHEQERRLTVKTATGYFAAAKLGDSIMIDGVCLTITTKTATEATFDVMVPTVMTTKIGQYQPGTHVNLEKAMLATDRFDGHFVLGHVDGTGQVTDVHMIDETVYFTVQPQHQALMQQIVPKGSIAMNGVSLTVIETTATTFTVGLIPHTLTHTMLQDVQVGDDVNLETDILAKYLAKERG